MRRRARLIAVLAILLGGALGVISSTQTWVVVTLDDGAVLEVPGSVAVPVLTPLSLAALALGGALTLVGRALRWILGTVAVLLAIVLVWQPLMVLTTLPIGAVAATVTEATGISGVSAVADLVAVMVPTLWPAIGAVGGGAVGFGGAIVLTTAHQWTRTGRRYDTSAGDTAAHGPLDAVDSWDELSRGDDPTEGTPHDR